MSASDTTSLSAKLSNLPQLERTILQLLAFFRAPVARTPFISCLQRADIRMASGKAIQLPDITQLFKSLTNQELVTEKTGGYHCVPQLQNDLIVLSAEQGTLRNYLDAVKPVIRKSHYHNLDECLQDLRLALYEGKREEVNRTYLYALRNYSYYLPERTSPYGMIFPEPVDRNWFTPLPQDARFAILRTLADDAFWRLTPSTALPLIEYELAAAAQPPPDLLYDHAFYLLMQGNASRSAELLKQPELETALELKGMVALLQGDTAQAVEQFETRLVLLKKQTGKRKLALPGMGGLLHPLALIRCGAPADLKRAVECAELSLRDREHPLGTAIQLLWCLAHALQGNTRYRKDIDQLWQSKYTPAPFTLLTGCLIALQLKNKPWQEGPRLLRELSQQANLAGFHWIAAEATLLRNTLYPDAKNVTTDRILEIYQTQQLQPLFSGNGGAANNWERSLKALQQLGNGTAPQAAAQGKEIRLTWCICNQGSTTSIVPIEQKQGAKGWSKGRNVALKRLLEDTGKLDFLTPQDRSAAACIRKERGYSYGYYAQTSYEFDTIKTLKSLIGHPLLFNLDDEPMTIASGAFALSVRKKKKGLSVTLEPQMSDTGTSFYRWDSPNRLLLYEPSAEQRKIADIIGNGLTIPLEAEQQLSTAVTAVAPHVMVQSDLATVGDEAQTVKADNRLHILLRPSGAGVQVELRVRPFGEQGPLFLAGQGGSTVIAEVAGKRQQCQRSLQLEKQQYRQLLEHCSTFDLYDQDHDIWRIENPDGTLELLEELHEILQVAPDAFVLQWPEGERFKLRGSASWQQLKLSVSSGKDWFSLDGEIAAGEDQVLSLQRLLELGSGQKGRFIQLAEGEFLALTEEFRRKLQDLQRLMDRHGKEQRIHQLSAPLLEEALFGTGSLKGDKGWKQLLERFKTAQELQPVIPPTLQTELRDYQQEGFAWLCRLAHWGVGACLADDMGLGKTVQALALLLTRAPAGAALVLAPTSVCLNWESEARRFAPTLNPRTFGSGNRTAFIASLQPFDLVICSYTLFQQEAELLTDVTWETVVLDEAQAIKNMTTKRSQAAMQLKAGFRIATTGTPVENRLDELWNLFRFLNPGLLGSHQAFSERFGTPIERDQNKAARTLLKKLIRPFILRRTKSQVLEELPPRTDILQRVELSTEEAAFYEALRRKALETLQGGEEQGPGERQIRILAEIMRLRRACCNPALVMPNCGIGSAKLAAFNEIVTELRANGHRALVFSQFVDHLSILRASLEQQGISYQYLDGSTPQKERQERVNAFQSGQGELFLISLKAGGTGLNLTAADYVIHVDPWWNPAVEDQASDRAHRIGQQRPVTVYRLVAANTIEEKIVALHGQKRDLANSLLEGTETAARVSADDLMELLREAG